MALKLSLKKMYLKINCLQLHDVDFYKFVKS